MKTKTIDVWIRHTCPELNLDMGATYSVNPDSARQGGFEITKAKLVIELPEPKVEVTQSQLRKAIRNGMVDGKYEDRLGIKLNSRIEDTIEELFGEDYEE